MGPIAIFDSGYGGLTVLDKIRKQLPQYDYIYLGDNARTPYGNRSFEVVYEYTKQAVIKLFQLGAPLVILACNTASAKALRTIQQRDLPVLHPDRRVLGVIRPSVELVKSLTTTKNVGVLGTIGTIQSESYPLEIFKLFPDIKVYQEACPMWVPLVENNEFENEGADYFIQKNLNQLVNRCSKIDTIILGCTHYPLLIDKIRKYLSNKVNVIEQGKVVADSLEDYLYRHPEIESRCRKNAQTHFYTTESSEKFKQAAGIFLKQDITVEHITL